MIYVRKTIIKTLHDIKNQNNIEIVYACEAGSRMRGFNSEFSDYDVRFIYKHKDIIDYISLGQLTDYIQLKKDNFDFVGWDINKTLNLHYKSNPSFYEWLNSKIVYIDNGINEIFKDLVYFNIQALKQYYTNIAKKHWEKYCKGVYKSSINKQYLYVIMVILSWKILNKCEYPPIDVNELINISDLSNSIKYNLIKLFEYSKINGELSKSEINDKICFIKENFKIMEDKNQKYVNNKDFTKYNERFKEIIGKLQ